MNDLAEKTSGGPVVEASHSDRFLSLDPRFIHEVASGLEDITDIAPRYGLTPEDVNMLMSFQPFIIAVDRLKSDFYRNGRTFRSKAQLMAETVMDRVYADALKSESLSLKLESLKTLARLADLEPKQSAGQVKGTGFTININLSGAQPAPAAEVVEVSDANS